MACDDTYNLKGILLMEKNLKASFGKINREQREKLLNQKGLVIWFTGLSGAGKSTIAVELEKKLHESNYLSMRLDGDNIRMGINSDLSFSDDDRKENIRRITEVANLFKETGVITITAFISPFQKVREAARSKIGEAHFLEVYIYADLETCIQRDPKGYYKKAMNGEIKDFTGIKSSYEEPENPDVILDTTKNNVDECVQVVYDKILEKLKR